MIYVFGDCEVDVRRYEVRRGGSAQPAEPQVFDVLVHLIRHRDRVVSKDELLDEVWGNRFVSESALTSRLRDARRLVGDDGRSQQVIRTLHGRGYRFVAEVSEHDDRRPAGRSGGSSVGAAPGRRPSPAGPSGRYSPLVERDRELAALDAALDTAAGNGTGTVVLVVGEAGIGKSSLVEAFALSAGERATVLVGRCDALLTPRPMGPFREMAEVAGGDLADALNIHGDHDRVVGVLLRLLSVGPTVLVVEDAHWADDATIDTVRILARRTATLPTVLVVSYRDEEVSPVFRGVLGALTGRHVQRLHPQPLTATAVAELAGGSGLDAAQLHAVTRGNPFFVSEVMSFPEAVVPATVRDAVLGRIAGLTPSTKHLLGRLSVVPQRAERWLATALAPDAHVGLSEAERHGVLNGDATHVWFRHELARRAVEEALTTGDRLQANQIVVDALVDRDPVDDARVVHHAKQAADGARLHIHARLAAAEAARLGSHRQAIDHYRVVLDSAGGVAPPDVARVSTWLAYSLYLINHFEESFQVACQAARQAEATDGAAALADALSVLSRAAYWARGPGAAERAAAREVEVLEAVGDDARLATALGDLARARSNLATVGSVAEPSDGARQVAEQALELADRLERDDLRSHALNYRGSSRLALGDHGGAEDLERAIDLARRDTRVEFRVRACVNAAGSAFRAGRLDDAERYVGLGLALATDGEFFAGDYRLALTLEAVHVARGQWAEAEAGLRDLIDRPGEPGIMRPLARALLARVLARRGEYAGADAVLAPALMAASSSDEIHVVGPVTAADVELAWLRGDSEDPSPRTDRALKIAARAGHRTSEAEIRCYLQRAGHPVVIRGDEPGPWGPALAGDWRTAARAWERLGERYEQAVELAFSGDDDARETGREILARLGATAAISRLAQPEDRVRRGSSGRTSVP
jgi:DNA-binding winged helix-turn-helix (wHTH) protein/tetratricopeptide (TPR) repeat protein